MVFFENFFIHAGLVIKAFQVADGGELHPIPVTLLILGEYSQVEGGVLDAMGGLVETRGRSNIRLHSQYRLDALLQSFFIKFNRPKHIAVIRQSNGRKFKLIGLADELRDFAGAVQEAVLGMLM
jgi:hypothetical protein